MSHALRTPEPERATAPGSGSDRPADTRGERERAAIMRAGHRLIGHAGHGTTPLEDILRAAGVNRRTFYRHFPSKDALVLAMQNAAGDTVERALQSAVVAAGEDSRAAAVAWIEEFLGIGWDERRSRDGRTFLTPEVGLVAGIADAIEGIHARHRRILAAVLRRGLADGSLPRAQPDRDAFAIHAVVLRHLEMRARGRTDRPFTAVRDDIIALFLPPPTAAGRTN